METRMATRITAIKEIVKNYQQTADEIIGKYSKELEMAKKRYSKETFSQESRKIWSKYSGALQAEAILAVNNAESVFEGLLEQVNNWVLAPVDDNSLKLLNTIHNFELKLSSVELKMIEKHLLGSYFGIKILSGIAAENGYFLAVPDVSKILREIRDARRNTEIAIKAYAGHAGTAGKALLEGATYIETDKGKYNTIQNFFAADFLKKDGILDRLEALLEEFSAPADFTLTEEEKKRIHGIFGDNPTPEVVKKVFADDPELFNKLGYVPAYRDIISQYVSESNE